MTSVTRTQLAEAVGILGLNYQSGPDKPILVPFGSDAPDASRRIIGLHPTEEPRLWITVVSERDCTAVAPDLLLGFCNQWNSSRRWPTAHVSVLSDEIRLDGDMTFPLVAPMQTQQLATLVDLGIRNCLGFCAEVDAFCETNFTLDEEQLNLLMRAAE